MFKRIVVSLAVIGLMLTGYAYAIDLQVGTEVDITLDKTLTSDTLDMFNAATGQELDVAYSAQYFDVVLEAQIVDWLKISPKAGFNYCQGVIELPMGAGDVELNSGLGFNAGLDVEATVYKNAQIVDVALIGGYRFSRTDLDKISFNGLTISNPIETIIATHEYEFGAKAKKDLTELVGIPIDVYLALVYSDLVGEVEANLALATFTEDINAVDNFGIRVGVASEPIENLKLGVDARFLDELAVTAKVSYLF